MGTLFVVSTPIGNLKDITFRALEVLKEVDLVLAEDTRKTGFLLAHYQIKKPLLSYFEGNEERRIPEIIKRLLEGEKIALVSNAGTPLLSDPGFKLIREAINKGIKIESIPGASALLAALVSSGLPMDKFIFLGFLPKKPSKQQKIFKQIKCFDQVTVILYESPHRLLKTISLIKESFGAVKMVVGHELTKFHEQIFRGLTSQINEKLKESSLKGEFVVVFGTSKEK